MVVKIHATMAIDTDLLRAQVATLTIVRAGYDHPNEHSKAVVDSLDGTIALLEFVLGLADAEAADVQYRMLNPIEANK